jgi:ribosome-associated toxin RatA of RatAB toxin-antitoxin module
MCHRLATVLLLLTALAFGPANAAASLARPPLELTVARISEDDGSKVYQIASSGTVAAAPAVVWRILTDYSRLADFVPDLKSARVVSRTGDKVIIDQQGSVRLLFFSQPIRLRVEAHEQAPNRIDVSLVDGDMKVYRCAWELTAGAAGGTTVKYTATIEPKFYVPGLVGASLVRRDIASMMAAVLQRMDRDE